MIQKKEPDYFPVLFWTGFVSGGLLAFIVALCVVSLLVKFTYSYLTT